MQKPEISGFRIEETPARPLVEAAPPAEPEPEFDEDEFMFDESNYEEESKLNAELLAAEKREQSEDAEFDFLYPTLNDKEFNYKIAQKKEFFDTQYDGTIDDIKRRANELCDAEFELMPHQMFTKNFMSFQTPYNSLFLYHGLGSGKSCSAIGIAEETRNYQKDVGLKTKIIMVAFPNVQENFQLQLFDKSKLKCQNGQWNINACLGNSLLKEINPTGISNLSREHIISKIRALINSHYSFNGYNEFANIIERVLMVDSKLSAEDQHKMKVANLRKKFDNRLLIIDEVHNVRSIGDSKDNRKTIINLIEVVKYAQNLRLVLMSATPMYNSYKEIIWLTNLMNLNDRRARIRTSDVFTPDGEFVVPRQTSSGEQIECGRELLMRKLTGYISFVRSDNPYLFPYRVYPDTFSPKNSFASREVVRPSRTFNDSPIKDPLSKIKVYLTHVGEYQKHVYRMIIRNIVPTVSLIDEHTDDVSYGFRLLTQPLQALTMVYPSETIDRVLTAGVTGDMRGALADCLGKLGLERTMTFVDNSSRVPPEKFNFDYQPDVLATHGRIFSREHIGKYSSKIKSVCDSVLTAKGIIIVYAYYIPSGIVPIALALEEMGMTRYSSVGTKSLFSKQRMSDVPMMNARAPGSEGPPMPAKYAVISGEKWLSPTNAEDMTYITSPGNKNGELVKVVIISKAASEGLDFKNIRQIHIIDPWYNVNRIQQIIGRGVRNVSHCSLPFEERNVEIYLHASLLRDAPDQECMDLYVYRIAERKAIQIGKITRLLKECSVDCMLNIGQTNFTVEKLNSLVANQNIMINLSSGVTIPFRIGDQPFSDTCDYMESCEFSCIPDRKADVAEVRTELYQSEFIKMNIDSIVKKIKNLFKDRHMYKRTQLVNAINLIKQYPIEQIFFSLTYLINNKTEWLVDKYGRTGSLENKGEYYMFQPMEITDDRSSLYDRSVPVPYKRKSLVFDIAALDHAETSKQIVRPPGADYIDILSAISESSKESRAEVEITTRTRWSWSMHASVISNIIETSHGIPAALFDKYVVLHELDSLRMAQRIILLNTIYASGWVSNSKLETEIKQYFDDKIMVVGVRRAILLVDDNNVLLLHVQNVDGGADWTLREPVDEEIDPPGAVVRNFGGEMRKLRVRVSDLDQYVGFFSCFKTKSVVFKIKDLAEIQNRQNKGFSAEQAGKNPIANIINTIQSDVRYTHDTISRISQVGICVILEMLMRFLTSKTNAPTFFLSQEQAYLIQSHIMI